MRYLYEVTPVFHLYGRDAISNLPSKDEVVLFSLSDEIVQVLVLRTERVIDKNLAVRAV